MATDKPRTIHEAVAAQFQAAWDQAVQEFRAGADSINLDYGCLKGRLYDLKDNADRETARISLDELGVLLRHAHMNGAGLAATHIADRVASFVGGVVTAPELEEG